MASDVELLRAWRSGDASSGEALVGAHYDAVLRFFRTKAGADADDLAQRTFLRCVEPRSDYQGLASFRSFLFGIARNVLFEHIRSCVRDRKVDPDFSVQSVLDLNPRASTAAFAKAEQQQLVYALQQLPLELQLTLELFYWEELPVEEVASVLEVPPGTVKSRLHRGRTLLRELIERAPPSAGMESVRAQLTRWSEGVRELRPEPGEPDRADEPGLSG